MKDNREEKKILPAVAGGSPVRQHFLPRVRPLITSAEVAAVTAALTGDCLTAGPRVTEFEKSMAEYVGAKYAVAFSSGTAALHAACFAAGIGQGDEVITSPITFVASSSCALYLGAKPNFADIDPHTFTLDPAQLETRITPKTKAVIPVHFAGHPCAMDEIMALARKHNLVVIEDAAHALGAVYRGRRIGSIGDMTVFSFNPTMSITTAEGGMVTTDNEEYYQWLRLFRNHGIVHDPDLWVDDHGPWYYEMQDVGFNYRLSEIHAALGLSQLQRIDDILARRRAIASRYSEALADLPAITLPREAKGVCSSWHFYVLTLNLERLTATRREIFEALRAENIGVEVHYLPVYRHPYYRWLGDPDSCSLSGFFCWQAEEFYQRCLTLPLFPAMSDEDVEDVIAAVRKVISYYSKSS